MKRALVVLALVAGCEKKETPEPKAPAPPVATRPVDAAVSAAEVVIETARVVVGGTAMPDVDGEIDRGALEAKLRTKTGEIVLGIAPDATYQRLIDVMDVAIQVGLEPVIDVGGKTNDPMPPADQPVSDEPILVVAISTDAIMLGQEVVAKIAELPAGDVIPALRDAIAANPRKRLALQADRATRGELVIRVIASAQAAGIPDVLFVVNTRPDVPLPRKRAN